MAASFRHLNQDVVLCLTTTLGIGLLGGAITERLYLSEPAPRPTPKSQVAYVVLVLMVATLFFIASWRPTATLCKIAVNVTFYTSLVGSCYCKGSRRVFWLAYAITSWSYLYALKGHYGAYFWFLDAARMFYGRGLDTRRVTAAALATIGIATFAGMVAKRSYDAWYLLRISRADQGELQ